MSAFAALAAGAHPAHDDLALGVAVELGHAEGNARIRMAELVARLPQPGEPLDDLEAVRRLVAELRPRGSGPLMLPAALRGGGHPAVVAVAVAAAAARAGLPVEPVGDDHGMLYLAHRDLEQPLVVDPGAPGRLVDARGKGADLMWRCGHETALCLLDHVVERAAERGDVATALSASTLRLALPLDDDLAEAASASHDRLLARLN